MNPTAAPAQDVPFSTWTTTSEDYPHELYRDVAEEKDIDMFLGGSSWYDAIQARWTTPAAATTTESLVQSFYGIISSILRRFVKPAEHGVERNLVNTFGVPECEEKNDEGRRVFPFLVLQGTGPSFQVPVSTQPCADPDPISVGYSNMATFFSVKVNREGGSMQEDVEEMATYARRIFRAQPNRLFVRCIALTEKYARLIHFDRGGAEITPHIDFHRYPSTLIRLVAGLGSTDEHRLGIDSSIQWEHVNGRKGKGTLTTMDRYGKAKAYRIIEQLRTPRHSMYGRATTCWRVQDPETREEFVVKESWQPADRPGEHELLDAVKGIPGVVQMVAHEVGRPQIKDFRCPSTAGRYQNRRAARMTLESYGPSIEHFTSPLEVLYALRDAVAGHRSLTSDAVRILHRDVSVYNVLLGRSGAPVGERGVLIDLDLAFRPTEAIPTVKISYDVGIRIFQPLAALGTLYMEDKAPPHDYLDDLESFFYLLVYIMLLYHPDGTRRSSEEEGPSIVETWSNDDPSFAYSNKNRILGAGRVKTRTQRLISASWGPACADLVSKFREFVVQRESEKHKLRYQGQSVESVWSRRSDHYAAVLAMLDDATVAIKASTQPEPANAPPQPAISPSPRVEKSHLPSCAITLPPPAIGGSKSNLAVADTLVAHGSATEVRQKPTPPPAPPNFPPQPRRSARIRDLHMKTTGYSPVLAVTKPEPQARRSARTEKRRLEDEQALSTPQPRAKRLKRGTRVNKRLG